MQVEIRHNPGFAVGRCVLAPNEPLRAESGAMAGMAPDVAVAAQMEGGMLRSLKRSVLGGESLFVTTYTAGPAGGWVDVAANLPGDLLTLPVAPGQEWNLTRGSWVASEYGVELDTKWGGFGNLVGGEGGFLVRATGQGTILVACYGALDVHRLGPGQRVVLDSGHLVAYTDQVQVSTRRIGGTMTSLKSGEGLVMEFTGPGDVLGQSRNPQAFLDYLTARLPFARQT